MLRRLLFAWNRVRRLPVSLHRVGLGLEWLEDRSLPSAPIYSSYFGGDVSDEVKAVAVDDMGDIYVAGRAGSDSLPGIPGERPPQANGFVAKFNPSGTTLLWAAYIDSDTTGVTAIAVDSQGNAYVTGSTGFSGFATTGAAQTSYGGNGDAFAVKLNGANGEIDYATYIGGDQLDDGLGVAVDKNGDAFVTGYTTSPNFPTKDPLTGQGALHANSGQDAFLTEISPDGSKFLFSTYLGGNENGPGEAGATYSIANAITLDANGNIYLTGQTYAADFPTTSDAFQPVIGSGIDVFVTEINAAETQVVYSTFLGGTGDGNDLNIGYGIALDSQGDILVTGSTDGVNFPITKHAFDTQVNHGDGGGNDDGFVTKIDPNATGEKQLVYSTYIGGSGEDYCEAIAVNAQGDAYVTGNTDSMLNFPLAHAFQKPYTGNAFVAEFSPTGKALLSSYYGGGEDNGEGIAVSPFGNVVFVGDTGSTRLPTTRNAFQPVFPGATDSGFIAILAGTPVTSFSGVDSQGDEYTVSLGGPGALNVIETSVNGPIDIYLEGTTSSSSLTIKVTKKVGDGIVDVASISGTGLRSISAAPADLDGSGIDLTGALGAVTLHDVNADAEIVAADSSSQSTNITAHVIGDGVTINTGGGIGTLKAASIGSDTITAVKLSTLDVTGDKSLSIAGDFDANMTLTGTGTVLGSATIVGTMTDAVISAAAGNIGTFKAGGFDASNVSGVKIGHVTLTTVDTENGGTKFGFTASQSIASLKVSSPSFTYNPKQSTPQGVGDFEVNVG